MSEPITREQMPEAGEGHAQPVLLAELITQLVTDAEERLRAAAEGRARGPVTGLKSLDDVLGNALEPGLHVVTGDPGAGKTALALQSVVQCGCPGLLLTAEQPPKVLFQRLIALITGTDLQEVKNAVPQRLKELAGNAVAGASQLVLLDALRGPARRDQIIGLVQFLRQRFDTRQTLLVVDSLQCWARGVWEGAEYEATQAGLSELVALAHELMLPILVLSHRNRASAKDKDGAAALTAAKGSADFEHLAETVLHLIAKGNGVEFAPDAAREVTVHVAKNRHGPSNVSLPLSFDPKTQTFSDRHSRNTRGRRDW